MKSPPEKAWLLDFDGTLYKAKPLRIAMAAELALLGTGALRVLRSFRRQHEVLRHELLADPELEFFPNAFEEQMRRAVDTTGINEELVRKHIEEWMIHRPTKWMRRFARVKLLKRVVAFRAQGGKTALVSDYPAKLKLISMGVHEHFDAVVASGEHPRLRRLKPAPDGFLLAAEELSTPPEDCLVIGDRDDADGGAARAAGMKFELVT